MSDVVWVCVAAAQEQDANEVRQRRVDRLEHLFKGKVLHFAANVASRNEVGQPKGVKGRKLFNFVGFAEPVFPIVEVLVVIHATQALWEVLEGGKGANVAITVDNRDCEQ